MSKIRIPRAVVVAALVVASATLGAGVAVTAQDGASNSGGSAAVSDGRAGAASPTENAFVPINPCRIADTRLAGGRMTSLQVRQFGMSGNTSGQGGAASCGIPSVASGLELSVTAVDPAGSGYLRLYPAGSGEPNATFLNYAGRSITNAGTVRVRPGASPNLQVKAYQASTHVVIDVLGYYVANLMAVVSSTGTLTRGNGVVSATRDAVGTYRVNFHRNISGCEWEGGLHDPGVFFGTPGEINLALNGSSPNGLFVQTRNPAGALFDSEFMVSVTC
ncbi:MAG: hypothetical protein GXY13_00195 [Acidimicrobiales bacterium]|nr:hypothetical protein [Acidimicrobiales bacterium]